MKKQITFSVLATAFSLGIVPVVAQGDYPYSPETHQRAVQQELSENVNDRRARSGLDPVEVSFSVAPSGDVVRVTYEGPSESREIAQTVLEQSAPFPRHTEDDPLEYDIELRFEGKDWRSAQYPW